MQVQVQVSQIERAKSRRYKILLFVFISLVALCFLASMNIGLIRLPPLDVLKTLFGGGTHKQDLVLFEFRLPRIVISVLVGAGLAVSGAILQGVSRNGLADPGLLGINAGAGLAVVLFIAYFPTKQAAPIYAMPVAALVGAALTAAVIYLLAYKKGQGSHRPGLLWLESR
jgi:iron complex transport system permease protein